MNKSDDEKKEMKENKICPKSERINYIFLDLRINELDDGLLRNKDLPKNLDFKQGFLLPMTIILDQEELISKNVDNLVYF